MLKAVERFLALAFGKGRSSKASFHPFKTCPECGTPLMRPARRDELLESQTNPTTRRDELHESPIFSPTSDKSGDSCNSSLRNVETVGDSRSSSLRTEENWSCPNLDCPALIRARIEHWCSATAMDIPGASSELIGNLVSKGLVRDVSELYRLKVKELAALPVMDPNSAQQFFDALTASLKGEAWRLLFGLGIPNLSAAEAKSLCAHFGSADNVLAASFERLMKVEGVGAEAANSVARWSSDSENRRLIKRLHKAGLSFKA